ncbi:PREDICTED: uncharacterized protein LOC109148657 [Ipomoea nil]|uniref:uncharacterized protein LOC109148657 n=1 Tax=Ipomoea nil TaxID=35883 RepID=UPI000901B5ED|nr:PREDICTED: uncharacterized protein LOC109148657 [Ipomoea nil]
MEIWKVLMELGEGDEHEKDNKLTLAMKKFEDFKMLPNETIMDMELRFTRLMGDLTDLGKELSEKEKNLKILRGLPKSWEMKVIAMRENRDMKTTSTTKIFSDLKEYEFEHELKDVEKSETRNVALVASQQATNSNKSKSNSSEFLSDEQYALFVRKMKRFMRKNNFQDSHRSGHRKQHESSPQTSKAETPDSQLLCYNCHKPGHFKTNCPHPIVSKHQDSNATKSPSKETGERYKRNDRPESSSSRNERRRKAMVVNKTSDTVEAESSSSSSSSDDESTEEEKGLLCLFSQESEDLCLMADEDEVNSHSSSCYSAKSSSVGSQTSNESVTEMMRRFKVIKSTYSKLKEENSRLMISYNALRQVRVENIKLAIAKEQLEKNVLALKEQLPGERTGIGFDPSSSSQVGLNKPTNAYSHESFQAAFVQGPTQVSEPMTEVNNVATPQSTSLPKGKAVQRIVDPRNENSYKGNPRQKYVKRNGPNDNRQNLNHKRGQPNKNIQSRNRLNVDQRQYRPKPKNPDQGNPRNGRVRQNERSFKGSSYGNGWTGPSEEDWFDYPEPLSKAEFKITHLRKQNNYLKYYESPPQDYFRKRYNAKTFASIHYDYYTFNGGCSRHMTGDKTMLSNFKEVDGPKVIFGGENSGKTRGKGDIIKLGITIQDVSYVDGLKFNLLSTSQFCNKGYKVEFSKNECKIVNTKDGKIVLTGQRKKNMYVISWNSSNANVCFVAKSNADLSQEWHNKLSHLNLKTINKLAKRNLVRGLPEASYTKDKICEACQKGKEIQSSFKSNDVDGNSCCLSLLHMDLFRPVDPASLSGRKCFIHNNGKNHLRTFDERADEAGIESSSNPLQNPQSNEEAVSDDEDDILSSYTKYQLRISEPETITQEKIVTQQSAPDAPTPSEPMIYVELPYIPEMDAQNQQNAFEPNLRWLRDHPPDQVIGNVQESVKSRASLHENMMACFLSQMEPKSIKEALSDPDWVIAMQEELH